MAQIGRTLAFYASAFCLGATFIIYVLFAASARYSEDNLEGCIGKVFSFIGLMLVAFFLYLALTIG